MKLRNTILVFFSICTVISAVTLIAIGKDYFRPAEGYILDERFISAYTAHYNYSYSQLVFTAIAPVITGCGILFALFFNRLTPRRSDITLFFNRHAPRRRESIESLEAGKKMYAGYLAIMFLLCYTPCAIKICQHMTCNSHVEEVTLEQKYLRKEARGSGNNERFYYYFAFSNGTHTEVPKDTYDQYEEEHGFCIIVSNDGCIGYFDADQYSLP